MPLFAGTPLTLLRRLDHDGGATIARNSEPVVSILDLKSSLTYDPSNSLKVLEVPEMHAYRAAFEYDVAPGGSLCVRETSASGGALK